MQRRWGLVLFLIWTLGSCTLLFRSLIPPSCEGTQTRCDGDILVSCEAGFESQTDCGANLCQADPNGAFCLAPAECGNSVIEVPEECEDGNTTSGDGCSSLCRFEFCGDGTINNVNEQCEPPGAGACGDDCRLSCQIDPDCADTNACTLNERCDNGSCAVDTLDPNDFEPCTVDLCDPLNGASNDPLPDGVTCDDNNNATLRDVCQSATCVESLCGDGFLDDANGGAEGCDDGNTTDGDGCSALCQIEAVNCGNNTIEPPEQCDDGNLNNGDGCQSDCTNSSPPDLIISSFLIERHDQDLEYILTLTNQGETNLNTPIRVDVYHDRNTPPGIGTPGIRSGTLPSLGGGASGTVILLLAIAEDVFDSTSTNRNDFALVDPFNNVPESNEANNLAGPNNGAVPRDFCAPCSIDGDCDFGECLTIGDTDEGFCTEAPCASDSDCNLDAACASTPSGNRCVPVLDTCRAHCEQGSLLLNVSTSDFVNNGDGSFTATLTGSTAGLPNRTQPQDGGSQDSCFSDEGESGEAFFLVRLTEGAFPNGLLGNAVSANLTVNTLGTNNFGPDDDTMLYLRSECMDERPSAQLDCDDDSGSGPGLDAELNVANLPKGSYVIVLDGFGANNEGPFTVNITVRPN